MVNNLESFIALNSRADTSGVDKLANSINQLTQATNAMGASINKNMNKAMNRVVKEQRAYNKSMDESRQKTKWFKMEFLGLMFFGQAIARMSKNLLQPALDAFSVAELWQSTLLVLFLPIVELIFPLLLWFMEQLMNMPDWAKLLVGGIAVIAFMLGTLASVIGTVVMGWGSLMMAGPQIIKFFVGLKAAILGINLATLGWGALIAGVIIAIGWLYDKFEPFRTVVNWAINPIVRGFELIIGVIAKLTGWDWAEDWAKKLNKFTEDTNNRTGDVRDIFKKETDSIEQTFSGNMVKMEDKAKETTTKIIEEFDRIDARQSRMKGIFVSGGYDKLAGENISSINRANEVVNRIVTSGGAQSILNQPVSSGYGASETRLALDRVDAAISGRYSDVIWRPGQAPIAVSPDDTVVAYKNAGKGAGGMSGVSINQTINVTASNKDEITRLINDANKRLVDDVKRMVGA